eukprot:1914650-Rhodomonas_salina.2
MEALILARVAVSSLLALDGSFVLGSGGTWSSSMPWWQSQEWSVVSIVGSNDIAVNQDNRWSHNSFHQCLEPEIQINDDGLNSDRIVTPDTLSSGVSVSAVSKRVASLIEGAVRGYKESSRVESADQVTSHPKVVGKT